MKLERVRRAISLVMMRRRVPFFHSFDWHHDTLAQSPLTCDSYTPAHCPSIVVRPTSSLPDAPFHLFSLLLSLFPPKSQALLILHDSPLWWPLVIPEYSSEFYVKLRAARPVQTTSFELSRLTKLEVFQLFSKDDVTSHVLHCVLFLNSPFEQMLSS